MVPSGRLELPRPYEQQILSLPRLPIPPQGPTLRVDTSMIYCESMLLVNIYLHESSFFYGTLTHEHNTKS